MSDLSIDTFPATRRASERPRIPLANGDFLAIVLAGHKTSVSLEDEFWKGMKEIAGKRLITLSTLVDTIAAQRQQGNLSSALRLFVLEYYRNQIPEVEGRGRLPELMERPKAALLS